MKEKKTNKQIKTYNDKKLISRITIIIALLERSRIGIKTLRL